MKTLTPPLILIKNSFYIFFDKKNLVYLLKLSFLAGGILFSFSKISPFVTGEDFVKNPLLTLPFLIIYLLLFLSVVWAQAATYEAVFRVVGEKSLGLKETFKKAWGKTWKFFLLSLTVVLLVSLGFVLLIVPGIVLAVWFSFSQFILISEGLGVRESLGKSRALVKGRFFPVLGRLVVFILVFWLIQISLSIIPFFGFFVGMSLGPFFLLPFYLLYRELSTRKELGLRQPAQKSVPL